MQNRDSFGWHHKWGFVKACEGNEQNETWRLLTQHDFTPKLHSYEQPGHDSKQRRDDFSDQGSG